MPKLAITLASEPWILAFDAKDFAVQKNGLQPDGRAYLLAENQKTNVTLSVYLEKVSGAATEADCDETQKQRLAENAEYKREMVVTKKSAGMTIVEYTIPEFQGVPIQQRNLFACLPKDDVYADIHLSKVTFKPQEEKLFTDILDPVGTWLGSLSQNDWIRATKSSPWPHCSGSTWVAQNEASKSPRTPDTHRTL